MISLFRCCSIKNKDFINSNEYLSPIHKLQTNQTPNSAPQEDSLDEGLNEKISHKLQLYPPLQKTQMRIHNTTNQSSHKSILYRKMSSHSEETLITSGMKSDKLKKKVGKIAEALKKISRTRSSKAPYQYETMLIPSPKSNFKFFTTYYRCTVKSQSTRHLPN